jgi:hypothetical protein
MKLAYNKLSPKDTSLVPSEEESELFCTTIVHDYQPTIIDEHESAFTQRVSTTLPYRDVIGGEARFAEVMIGRECVVQMDYGGSVRALIIPLQCLLTQMSQRDTVEAEFLCI